MVKFFEAFHLIIEVLVLFGVHLFVILLISRESLWRKLFHNLPLLFRCIDIQVNRLLEQSIILNGLRLLDIVKFWRFVRLNLNFIEIGRFQALLTHILRYEIFLQNRFVFIENSIDMFR